MLKIVDEIEDNSHILCDITYGPKDLPIVLFSVLNFAEKYAYLKKATELGDSDAKAYLGIMYYNGFGVARSFDKALKYYK